ncbi:SpoIIE family protein phosphatase [Streptomyces sp. NPDC046931]|uniref:SpoIIE family protein phosphatase n=1 Tax=Streptomyces sp. NPDC046931 TaxID=3154806 RepID=UPI0033CF2059
MDTSQRSSSAPPGNGHSAAWGSAPCPVVVADGRGRVVELNAVAASLFPEAGHGSSLRDVVPPWLFEAHDRFASDAAEQHPTDATPASGRIGERSFEARPAPSGCDHVMWWLMDDTDRRAAEEALRSERERTAFLARASTTLLASLHVETCMEAAARLAVEHLADAAVTVTPGRGRGHPVTSCGPSGEVRHTTVRGNPEDVPGLAEALRGFPPVPSRWIDPGALPDWAVPQDLAGPVGSVVVSPLPGHGVPAGALILLRTEDRRTFGENEEVFARLFAARAGAAISAARMYADQTAITTTLMRELLPPQLHSVHGVEFAGAYRPHGGDERAGGDFYDVHPGATDEEETLVVLGDVCGKGLEAAVLTGKIRNTLQALLPLAADHQSVLGLLNGALIDSHHTRFATLALASVIRRGGTVRLRVTSAGHPAPLLIRADGRVEEADTRGTLVGVFPEITSTTAHLELTPGETCLLFTDGIVEARGGPWGDELFGTDRLKAALAECVGMPAEAVVEHAQTLAAQWVGGGGHHDDMAVVAVTAPHHAHLSAVDGRTRGRYTA